MKIDIQTNGMFLMLLTVLFIGLKLSHVINWSWWWVLSPIWLPLIISLVILAMFVIGYLIIKQWGKK